MKRILALALLACLAAPVSATIPGQEGAWAASRCLPILSPSCSPPFRQMSRASLAVFRYLTVYDIYDLTRNERRLAFEHLDQTVKEARSGSPIACKDADRVIKVMQKAPDRRVRQQADDFVTRIMERYCQ